MPLAHRRRLRFGVSGLALSSASPQVGGVGVFGFGGMSGNSSSGAWGANFVGDNCPTPDCITRTGFTGAAVWGIEVDVNIMKTPGGGDPGMMQVHGVQIIGASETQVGSGGLSVGLDVSPLGIGSPIIPWQVGIGVKDGAALEGLALGSLADTGITSDSQPACWVAYDSGNSAVLEFHSC